MAILVASALAGCSDAPSDSSALTILSITEGDVFVMKAGTDHWTEATIETTLGIGDTVKTGDDSGAEITFFDGSTIELEAGTQIEITSLDSSPDTGMRTITLMQTIGTTISRVTKLLDPASSYAVETPSGVAAVRGSTMIVRIVFNDPNYEDGTVLIANLEGHIYWIGDGEELQLPEGAQVIATNETAELVQLSLAVDDSVATDEDTPVTVAAPGVLANDSGLVVGDTLAVTAVDTTGTVGNVTAWGADGSFTYDPDGQFEALGAGDSTADSFTYTVTNSFGITDTAAVTITISGADDEPPYSPPVNHAPAAVDDAATTDEDNPVSAVAPGVLSNDSDPDVGDILTVTSFNTTGTLGAVTAWDAFGSFTYDPGEQFEYLPVGSSTTDSFTYMVSDGHGGTDTAIVTMTINGINDPPVALGDIYVTNEDSPITVGAPGVLTNDSDPDVGDTLTVTHVYNSATAGTVTAWSDGSFTYDPDGQFDYLEAGGSTVAYFYYTVADGHSGTDRAGVTIVINGVGDTPGNNPPANHPPVAADDSATTSQNTSVTIDVLLNDNDIDNDILTVAWAMTPTTEGGSVHNSGGDVTYTPPDGFTGTDTFTYTVSDGNGGTDVATVTVYIEEVVEQTSVRIRVTIDKSMGAPVYVKDTTSDVMLVDGTQTTPTTVYLVAGNSYCVWVGGDATYDVGSCSKDWTISDAPIGGQQTCGTAAAGSHYHVHFTQSAS
jgi:VCBS repeat-containing protein